MAASFVPDYFLPLFVEDVYHKKGANRSGDSCLAIKSDLNPKPSVRSQKLPRSFHRAPFYRVSAPLRDYAQSQRMYTARQTFLANKQIAKWAVTPTPATAKRRKKDETCRGFRKFYVKMLLVLPCHVYFPTFRDLSFAVTPNANEKLFSIISRGSFVIPR